MRKLLLLANAADSKGQNGGLLLYRHARERGHRKVCIQNYGKEGQGILNGFGFLRTDSCPTGIQEKAF